MCVEIDKIEADIYIYIYIYMSNFDKIETLQSDCNDVNTCFMYKHLQNSEFHGPQERLQRRLLQTRT